MAIVGPTAVGKTAVGVALAQHLDGEIISADAVAVYRGLDIGAAKPTVDERESVPFHLIDVADPDEDFTVADFVRLAEEAITAIRQRGHVPILVGGTMLYVRAVTSKLSIPHVPPQPELRALFMAEAEREGTPALHRRLEAIDAPSAARIQTNDRKRIIRALEVYTVTGQPLSAFHTPEGVHGTPRPDTYLFGLNVARETLYARIEARVETMLATGLVEEVRGLLTAGYGLEYKSMQSLGYRHIAEHLTGGKDLETAVAELKRDTRRYAKRQLSWWNADPNVVWLDTGEKTAAQVSEAIARRLAHYKKQEPQ